MGGHLRMQHNCDQSLRQTNHQEETDMATIMKENNVELFELVHPLDDMPEQKHSPDGLGPMHMTRSVKWSLLALRSYLIIMALLVLYSVIQQSGIFGH